MPIQQIHADPAGAFIAGRAARQDYEYGQTRNALAQQEVADAPRRNALADIQMQGAQMGIDQERARVGYTRLQQALASGNPKAYVMQREPELAAALQKQGVDLASIDDQQAAAIIEGFAREYAGKAGIAPEAPTSMTPYQQAQIDLERDKLNQPKTMSPYEQARIDIENRKLNQPQAGYRTLSPQEVRAAGLPDGTSAQQGPDGKINVLSKRDNTGALSQKDTVTAKQKLTAVKIARQQLERIKQTFTQGRQGVNAFGPGQGFMATQQGKAFDAAVDQMRGTLTALTRVPGVGSMSDYESKIDQGKFPSRTDYESVTEQKIQGIEELLATIEGGYTDLLGGQPQQPGQPRQFATEAEAEAAGIQPGTRVIIGGVPGTWQ